MSTVAEAEKAVKFNVFYAKKNVVDSIWKEAIDKRTAQLVANKMLIADGRGILAIPPECKHDFGEKLKRFYETADDSELQKFLIETSIYN